MRTARFRTCRPVKRILLPAFRCRVVSATKIAQHGLGLLLRQVTAARQGDVGWRGSSLLAPMYSSDCNGHLAWLFCWISWPNTIISRA